MSRAFLARCTARTSTRTLAATAAAARCRLCPSPSRAATTPRGTAPMATAAAAAAAGAAGGGDPTPPDLAAAKALARDAAKRRLRAMSPEQMAEESAAVAALVSRAPFFLAARAVGLYATCARLREVDTAALIDSALAQGKRVHLPLVLDRQGGMALLHVPRGRRDLHAGAPPFGIAEPRSLNYLVPANAGARAAVAGAMGTRADGAEGEEEDEELVEGPEPRANALPEVGARAAGLGGGGGGGGKAPPPPPAPLDLLLVPGLAFDRAGRRLGRGGGYYDRAIAALRRLRPSDPPLLVALAFRAQVVEGAAAAGSGGEPPLLPTDDATDARVDVLATPDGLIACSARGRAALER